MISVPVFHYAGSQICDDEAVSEPWFHETVHQPPIRKADAQLSPTPMSVKLEQ